MEFFGGVLLAKRAHGMTNRHTQPSRAPARQTKRMTAKVLIATRADHAELRRVGYRRFLLLLLAQRAGNSRAGVIASRDASVPLRRHTTVSLVVRSRGLHREPVSERAPSTGQAGHHVMKLCMAWCCPIARPISIPPLCGWRFRGAQKNRGGAWTS